MHEDDTLTWICSPTINKLFSMKDLPVRALRRATVLEADLGASLQVVVSESHGVTIVRTITGSSYTPNATIV